MATHVAAHERMLCRVPAELDLVRAAAVPEVFMTAYDAIFWQGKLAMGENLLIHAVGSGVGTRGGAAGGARRRAGVRHLRAARTSWTAAASSAWPVASWSAPTERSPSGPAS